MCVWLCLSEPTGCFLFSASNVIRCWLSMTTFAYHTIWYTCNCCSDLHLPIINVEGIARLQEPQPNTHWFTDCVCVFGCSLSTRLILELGDQLWQLVLRPSKPFAFGVTVKARSEKHNDRTNREKQQMKNRKSRNERKTQWTNERTENTEEGKSKAKRSAMRRKEESKRNV